MKRTMKKHDEMADTEFAAPPPQGIKLKMVTVNLRKPSKEVAIAKKNPPMPPKLREADKANFATLRQADRNGDLALVSAIRKSDGKAVALVCAMGREKGMIYPTPLAVMIEGNPFEDFFDPMKG